MIQITRFFISVIAATILSQSIRLIVFAQDRSSDFLQPPGGGYAKDAPGFGGSYSLFGDFFPAVIRFSLGITGAVMLGFLIYAGILLVSSGADTAFRDKAKNLFYGVIIGAIIISIAFALVYGITQINLTGSGN